MTNTNNNTGITSDDIQKTKEYQEALDKLSKAFMDLILTVILFVSHKTDHYIYQ